MLSSPEYNILYMVIATQTICSKNRGQDRGQAKSESPEVIAAQSFAGSGRAASKTVGRGFDPFNPCHKMGTFRREMFPFLLYIENSNTFCSHWFLAVMSFHELLFDTFATHLHIWGVDYTFHYTPYDAGNVFF